MLGSEEMIDGCAYSQSRASWPIVTPRPSYSGFRRSTFCSPSTSHARGRCERWSLSSNFVSSVYLPSSMPDECGTRTRNCGCGLTVHARNDESNACVPTQAFDSSFRAWTVNPQPQFLVRVPHSSGMLEGKYTLETKFDESDHRSHRPRAWLVEGLQKVERLKPLYEGRGVTIGQLALLWLYAHPSIISSLPNIYGEEQLTEFAAASDHAPLSDAEMERVHELYVRNFDIVPYVQEAVSA